MNLKWDLEAVNGTIVQYEIFCEKKTFEESTLGSKMCQSLTDDYIRNEKSW